MPSAGKSSRKLYIVSLGIVITAAAVVRFATACDDLWLDEIWSLELIRSLHSPAEIFTQLKHDNNHPLNSLFIYFVRSSEADWVYRLLSCFAGIVTVWLAAVTGKRQLAHLHPKASVDQLRAAALINAIIFGGGYLLIHYSSEARGYALAVCFSLLAFYALLGAIEHSWSAWIVAYWLACIFGLLSHLISVQVMIAGVVWSAVKVFRNARTRPWRDHLIYLASWHLAPWAFAVFYYLWFVRKMEVGGALPNPVAGVLGDLASFSTGFPTALGIFAALPMLLGIMSVALHRIWRRDSSLVWFYVAVILIAPAIGVYASRYSAMFFPRHFIVSSSFALLLIGHALVALWTSQRQWRILSATVIALFVAGNAIHTYRLIKYGRGQYRQTLRYLVDHAEESIITLGSNNDFKNFVMIDYYSRRLATGHEFQYVTHDLLPQNNPQWFLVLRLDYDPPPPSEFFIEDTPYHLEHSFPHAALSGWDWYIFRKQPQIPD